MRRLQNEQATDLEKICVRFLCQKKVTQKMATTFFLGKKPERRLNIYKQGKVHGIWKHIDIEILLSNRFIGLLY